MRSSSTNEPFDVVVVGLGPVGAVLGNLLGGSGLRVAICERDAELFPLPRAVFFDSEVMRLMQTIGLAARLEPLLRASTGAQFIDSAGKVFLRRPSAEQESSQGWRGFYNFHQPEFEAVLREGLERYPDVEVLRRHEVYAIQEHEDCVTVLAEDIGSGRLRNLLARFVVGCDGARSLVRRLCGAEFIDLGMHEPWLVADFRITGNPRLPDMSTQYCDPEFPITFVYVVRDRRRFEFKLRPSEIITDVNRVEVAWSRVERWLTRENATLERAATYTFHSLVAQTWRRDRLIIAGDAAHQTPPFLGQGLCAGIRDVANLAWRITAVLKRAASPALLDSYGPERIPHATVFINMAIQMGRVLTASSASETRRLMQEVVSDGQTALVYPSPQLGPGIYDATRGGGVISPQPRLTDGRRLDEVIGYRPALIVAENRHGDMPNDLLKTLERHSISVVIACGAVQDWLTGMDRSFVLLRPDRYIYATATTVSEVHDAIDSLICHVSPGIGQLVDTPAPRRRSGEWSGF